ncbi:hypothetical protein FHW84_003775 [Dyella sp. SG562]|jgi:hypothetical protein|uniref:hypothetical protein n=1 Tax=Dyella sp. SG562 TaxID=2587017 RepID=UPI0014235D01|nr:hypothetical protein [Dyella sp. SG562]NII75177.1 hypothetical protein [Dyella sp. SG562]
MELNSIDDVRSNLEELWGRQLATEFAVKVLIDSHPARDYLIRLWDATSPSFLDHLMDKRPFVDGPIVREKVLAQLANYRGLLDTPPPL